MSLQPDLDIDLSASVDELKSIANIVPQPMPLIPKKWNFQEDEEVFQYTLFFYSKMEKTGAKL